MICKRSMGASSYHRKRSLFVFVSLPHFSHLIVRLANRGHPRPPLVPWCHGNQSWAPKADYPSKSATDLLEAALSSFEAVSTIRALQNLIPLSIIPTLAINSIILKEYLQDRARSLLCEQIPIHRRWLQLRRPCGNHGAF